jgi:hypothetical protein
VLEVEEQHVDETSTRCSDPWTSERRPVAAGAAGGAGDSSELMRTNAAPSSICVTPTLRPWRIVLAAAEYLYLYEVTAFSMYRCGGETG